MTYSVKVPAVVRRPILLVEFSVNQRAPSGPAVMPIGFGLAVGIVKVLKLPVVVMRPMASAPLMANRRALSEPTVMAHGLSMTWKCRCGPVASPVIPTAPIRLAALDALPDADEDLRHPQ